MNGTSNRSVLALWAALLLTGAVAVFATVSALSLRGELGALRTAVNGPPPAGAVAGGTGAADPAAPAAARDESLSGRLAAAEAKVREHERTIEDLSSIVAGLAGMTDADAKGLGLDADGEPTGTMAEKLRAFLRKERMAERREYFEKMASRIDSMVSEKHARFVEDHGLSPDKDRSLAELEADVHEKARALADAVMNGDKMWWEVRPEARTLFDDTMGRLNGLLGEELAAEYVERLAEDFPMLRRWTSRDGPGPGGPGAGAATGTAASGSGG